MPLEKENAPKEPRRIWIRLPNWLGDVVMAAPLIRAMKNTRSGVEITLLAQAHFIPLLEALELGVRLVAIPGKGGLGYFTSFARLRKEAPDVHFLLTNSIRGDLEARVVGAPKRYGIARPGKPRGLLTDTLSIRADLDEAEIHQTHLWEKLFRHFGFDGPVDYTPFNPFSSEPKRGRIGLICATENSPEKRWPVEQWRKLIESMPECEFHLFGTPRDVEITNEVADGFPANRVENRAGKTGLVEFASELSECEAVVGNDTGGMHLANLLGVPIVGLFGPTNPVRTGPILEGPQILVQPEGCPKTGGSSIEKLTVSDVVNACRTLLDNG